MTAIVTMMLMMTLMMAMMMVSWTKSERMIAIMTSVRILMRTRRKTNQSGRKITLKIFCRPHDMAELAGPGGVEQELRTSFE